ncbi:MAG: phosphate regulon sensor histidine kinase PhoR [Chromatiaceae bacterium]|nr:phosphate regulon sensor histidine kinase PhoR [Gammaproteobacteria bacterium]MCP5447657.1 phosphate regulon sensor histidine kinase PhoR [Chromatiaceae bacterium]
MQNWRREMLIVLPIGLAGTLVGLWIDHFTITMLLLAGLYFVWQLLQIHRFNNWQREPETSVPPFTVGIWGSIADLSNSQRERARKRKRKLGRMLAGFRESTNALPDATVILNAKGRMEWWNEVAKEVLGLDSKRDRNRNIVEIVPDSIFHAYLAKGDYIRPLQIPAPLDDNISLEVRIVPYGKGKRLLQARDITRLQQLETVRRDFVANVSHEMRTPLTVIHGYLETLAESGDEAQLGDWKPVVAQMRQQTDRMQRIVADLLMLSRLESEEQAIGQEQVDVAELLESVNEQAMNLSSGKHKIYLTAEAGLKLYGVENELESAFSNLAFNAVRYTPSGGSIAMHWFTNGDKASFSIKDNGIGIEPEHIPRLTERFYRVDVGRSRQSGGTGLGLAIVKHVLTRHGSVLEIESEPGRGSLFSCTFPEYRVCRGSPERQRRLAVH